MKTFVIFQFRYCPLVFVFHSRKLNDRINSIYERAISVTCQDYQSTFLQLSQKDNSLTVHQRNLPFLATKTFKAKNDVSPEIMKGVFELKRALL